MNLAILVIVCLLLVVNLLLLVKLSKPNNRNDANNWEILSQKLNFINEKIVSNGEKTQIIPEILEPKLDAVVAKNIGNLIREFGFLQESIIKNMGENKTSTNKDISEFKSEVLKNQTESSHKLSKEFSALKESVNKELGNNNLDIVKNITLFKDDFNGVMNKNFEYLIKAVQERLDKIDHKVTQSLEDGFKKSNRTFLDVVERLTKIDEAQKQIKELSTNVVSLQEVLTDKKTRGIFGEVQLGHILSTIFGEKNSSLYEEQYKLSSGTIVDSIIFLPNPIGNLGVDSKFPLENYERMYLSESTNIEKETAKKAFKSDVKKHIDAISNKYIIAGETADQAIMFLPAEAIFAELNAYHQDVIDHAQKKRVWLTSPTTLMSMLTIIQVTTTEMKRSQYMNTIHGHLNKLGEEFERYRKRWDGLNKSLEKVSKDVKEINTTSDKITRKFEEIKDVEVAKLIENNLEGHEMAEIKIDQKNPLEI